MVFQGMELFRSQIHGHRLTKLVGFLFMQVQQFHGPLFACLIFMHEYAVFEWH